MVDVIRVLNAAAVPPPQFIEVVRYAPAAVVVEETPDPFVVYLRDQYDRGLRGGEFVTVVQNRLRTYDLGPVNLNVIEPVPVTYYEPSYYEPRTFFPPVVQTRITRYYAAPVRTRYTTNDLLALAAMPLAVVAASHLRGVPSGELFQMVTLLNAAAVPPVQFIEVVRYAPPALIIGDGRAPFIGYLQDRYDTGLRGTQFVTVIEDRLRTYDLGDFDLVVRSPRIVRYEPGVFYQPDLFFPAVVRTRVIERSSHPHGGPPGQIKKQIGVQTGAEVVHGSRGNQKAVRYDQGGEVHDDDRGGGNKKADGGKSQGKGHGKGKGKGNS
jgi:hypothetical protein